MRRAEVPELTGAPLTITSCALIELLIANAQTIAIRMTLPNLLVDVFTLQLPAAAK
jgi:hypothetical protein